MERQIKKGPFTISFKASDTDVVNTLRAVLSILRADEADDPDEEDFC